MSDISGSGARRAPSMTRDYRPDPHTADVRVYRGVEVAQMVRLMAFAGIAARLFVIYASANRISVCHTLLGVPVVNGSLDLGDRADAVALASRAHDADSLATLSLVASLITIALYLMTLFSLNRRRKRGDALAAAINANRAVRFAGRLYLVAALCAVALRSAFKPAADAVPSVRLDDVVGGDVANIGVQLLVITFLVVVALAVSREIDRLRSGTVRQT